MKHIPNILTVLRVLFVPWIIYLIWPGIESPKSCLLAALLFIVAGTLDILDGFLARQLKVVSVLGQFLDPLADKLLHLLTLLALVQIDRVPVWVVMVVLSRELMVTGLRAIASNEGIVIAADALGKAKASFSTVGAILLLAHYTYAIDMGFGEALFNMHRAGLWLTYFSVVLSVYSGFNYVLRFVLADRFATQ